MWLEEVTENAPKTRRARLLILQTPSIPKKSSSTHRSAKIVIGRGIGLSMVSLGSYSLGRIDLFTIPSRFGILFAKCTISYFSPSPIKFPYIVARLALQRLKCGGPDIGLGPRGLYLLPRQPCALERHARYLRYGYSVWPPRFLLDG